MRYKMLVCDIDGTLLNSQSKLTPEVIAAVQDAHRAGVIVTLATGRQLRGVLSIVEELGVNVPVILGNGVVIADPAQRETLLHRPLERDTAHAILDVIRSHGMWAGIMGHTFEGVDTYYDIDPGFDEAYVFIHKDTEFAKQVEDLKEVTHEPIKVLLVERPEKVEALVEDLRKLEMPFNMVISTHDFPDYTFLEMFHHESTKASGIEHVAQLFNVPREQIVAVGDNVNDLEMIEYAGLGVAMGNAAAPVKEQADLITKSNDEHGVAHLIREYMLTGK
jgi:Cof subfamily protein (haloacid dehalogenase superfamily)